MTGAAGFIGSHLVDALLERGHEVVGVDSLVHGSPENLTGAMASPDFTFGHFDVRERARLVRASNDCEAVVHLAALKIPRFGGALATVECNVDGARAALEAARVAGAKCVLASTSDVYGKSTALPFREDGDCQLGPPTSRRWAYAASKLAVEHIALGHHEEHGVPVTLLRFFGTYGERQYLNWWGGPQGVFLRAIDEGRPLEVHGDGRQTRCYIHVDDLIELVARALERPEADGQILNVGTDEEISVRDLATLMSARSGQAGEPRLELVPYESFGASYEDVQRRVPDLTKMLATLGYMPEIRLQDGIDRLWAWYRSRLEDASRTG